MYKYTHKQKYQLKYLQIQIQKHKNTTEWDKQAVSGVKGGRWSGAAGSDWGGRHQIIATDNIISLIQKHVFLGFF